MISIDNVSIYLLPIIINAAHFTMDIRPLVKADLNLLVTLYAILDERSVSRAAEKLYVTQSAVSRSLSKMREIFDDPLFTRTGHQLVPTPFLEDMAPLLYKTLHNANSILQPTTFDPLSWHGTIKMGISEVIDMMLMPKLLNYLQKNAPGINIETTHFPINALEQLANSDLDIAISHDYSTYPKECDKELFLHCTTSLLARAGHPLDGHLLPFSEIAQYPKVSLRVADWEKTHLFHTLSQLRDSVLKWEADHEADSLLAAISIIRATDSLLPIPTMLAIEIAQTAPDIKFFTIDEYQDVYFDYTIITHQRVASSSVHQWFKGLLLQLAEEIKENQNLVQSH